jgi:hypothetical protein
VRLQTAEPRRRSGAPVLLPPLLRSHSCWTRGAVAGSSGSAPVQQQQQQQQRSVARARVVAGDLNFASIPVCIIDSVIDCGFCPCCCAGSSRA